MSPPFASSRTDGLVGVGGGVTSPPTSVFVHFGVIHLLMNLWALVSLARIAEPMLGAARFMIAYVVTGIFGFAVTIAWGTMFGQEVGLTAGASGAVFGVMGWLGVPGRRHSAPRACQRVPRLSTGSPWP